MNEQFKKTMGTLNLKVSQKAVFNEALRKRITDATTRRNFLAHHYWLPHPLKRVSTQSLSPEGLLAVEAKQKLLPKRLWYSMVSEVLVN
jgi:hypothetical protein